MPQKNLSALERLAAKALEDELAAIESDKAHYQKLLDNVAARVEATKAKHLASIQSALVDAGVIQADDEVDGVTVVGGRVTAVNTKKKAP